MNQSKAVYSFDLILFYIYLFNLQDIFGDSSAIDLNLGPKIDEAAGQNYKNIKSILERLTRLCCTNSLLSSASQSSKKPKKHEQRLLRNMGAHSVVLDLLQIPYEKVSEGLNVWDD